MTDEHDPDPRKKLKTWQNVLLLAGGDERFVEMVEESMGGGREGAVMLADRLH